MCGGVSTLSLLILFLFLFASEPLLPSPRCTRVGVCVPPSCTVRTVIQRYQQIAKSQRQTAGKCVKRCSRSARDTPRNRKPTEPRFTLAFHVCHSSGIWTEPRRWSLESAISCARYKRRKARTLGRARTNGIFEAMFSEIRNVPSRAHRTEGDRRKKSGRFADTVESREFDDARQPQT